MTTQPGQPTTQPGQPTAQPQVATTAPGELPKLTDPSTTAPDAETLARKQAEEAAKEAELKKKTSARVQTTPVRPTNRRDRDTDKEPPPKKIISEDTGFLRVMAYPSGWVSVDGGPKKATPMTMTLPAGKHKVKIFTDFESRIRNVEIEAGEPTIIKVDWEANEIQEN